MTVSTRKRDPFHAKDTMTTPRGPRAVYRLDALRQLGSVDTLPYCIKVLLEACLRNIDDFIVTLTEDDGTARSFRRDGDVPKVDIQDPLAALYPKATCGLSWKEDPSRPAKSEK